MAATANAVLKHRHGDRISIPVAAAIRHYEGTCVFITSAGHSSNVTATGANKFAGICAVECDNSAGAAGDKRVEVIRRGLIRVTTSGLTQASLFGVTLYASDDNTFTLTSTNNVAIGKIVEVISTTECIVDIEKIAQ